MESIVGYFFTTTPHYIENSVVSDLLFIDSGDRLWSGIYSQHLFLSYFHTFKILAHGLHYYKTYIMIYFLIPNPQHLNMKNIKKICSILVITYPILLMNYCLASTADTNCWLICGTFETGLNEEHFQPLSIVI